MYHTSSPSKGKPVYDPFSSSHSVSGSASSHFTAGAHQRSQLSANVSSQAPLQASFLTASSSFGYSSPSSLANITSGNQGLSSKNISEQSVSDITGNNTTPSFGNKYFGSVPGSYSHNSRLGSDSQNQTGGSSYYSNYSQDPNLSNATNAGSLMNQSYAGHSAYDFDVHKQFGQLSVNKSSQAGTTPAVDNRYGNYQSAKVSSAFSSTESPSINASSATSNSNANAGSPYFPHSFGGNKQGQLQALSKPFDTTSNSNRLVGYTNSNADSHNEKKCARELKLKDSQIEYLRTEIKKLRSFDNVKSQEVTLLFKDENEDLTHDVSVSPRLHCIMQRLITSACNKDKELQETKLRLEAVLTAVALRPPNGITKHGQYDEQTVAHQILTRLQTLKEENEQMSRMLTYGKSKEKDIEIGLLRNQNQKLKERIKYLENLQNLKKSLPTEPVFSPEAPSEQTSSPREKKFTDSKSAPLDEETAEPNSAEPVESTT